MMQMMKSTLTPIPQPVNALRYPSNTGSEFVALQKLNPQTDGLPFWGPSNNGWTFIWEVNYIQQTGYYALFWWSNNGAFTWDGGSSNTYAGCHPYPKNASGSDTDHWWELAGMEGGTDSINTLSGSPKTVVKGTKFVQAYTNEGTGTRVGRFYLALPSVANGDIIEHTAPAGFGNSNPPSPAFTIGDSPWVPGQERASCDLARVKIFAPKLTQADILSEAADMSRLVTANGTSQIWYGKNNWDSVDDLTCDYGTGRTFAWADAGNKATLVLY
jgi:hypothetical protein